MHSRAKHPSFIIAICSAIYFISYFARVNYAAIVVAIVCDFGVHVSAAGLVATASFFSYGIGQLVSGYMGDRISPKLLLVVGLIGTMFCNLGMAYSQSIEQMTILWLINGGFQALLWPPLVRLMVENLDPDEYRRGRELVLDLEKIKQIDGLLLHVTAKGKKEDCVSRSFAPKLAVAEDPVCGSGHCHISPIGLIHWAKRNWWPIRRQNGVGRCSVAERETEYSWPEKLHCILWTNYSLMRFKFQFEEMRHR